MLPELSMTKTMSTLPRAVSATVAAQDSPPLLPGSPDVLPPKLPLLLEVELAPLFPFSANFVSSDSDPQATASTVMNASNEADRRREVVMRYIVPASRRAFEP